MVPSIKELVYQCGFSLRVLDRSKLPYRLCGLGWGQSNGRDLSHIYFDFATSAPPGCVRVDNWAEGSAGQSVGAVISLGKRIIEAAPISWKQFLAAPGWKPYDRSGLKFHVAFWAGGKAPLGWACSDLAKPLVAVVAVGVSQSRFLELLDSLVILQEAMELLINGLQEELRAAYKEG